MIYARAHDQTVAEDYFAAMERIEQRLEIVPAQQKDIEDVKVQEPTKLFHLIQQLELPLLRLEERLSIVHQLRVMLQIDIADTFIEHNIIGKRWVENAVT